MTKVLQLVAVFAGALAISGIALADCQNVYNPMTGKWDYVCTDTQPQQCHQEYDPMNGKWVTVCR